MRNSSGTQSFKRILNKLRLDKAVSDLKITIANNRTIKTRALFKYINKKKLTISKVDDRIAIIVMRKRKQYLSNLHVRLTKLNSWKEIEQAWYLHHSRCGTRLGIKLKNKDLKNIENIDKAIASIEYKLLNVK
jgi:hypothetical protein